MSKINMDSMDETILKKLKAKNIDLSGLKTEDKSSLVTAINELFGKDKIATAFGSPLNPSDTWDGMAGKITGVEDKFRNVLVSKDVDVTGADDINKLVDKADIMEVSPIPKGFSESGSLWSYDTVTNINAEIIYCLGMYNDEIYCFGEYNHVEGVYKYDPNSHIFTDINKNKPNNLQGSGYIFDRENNKVHSFGGFIAGRYDDSTGVHLSFDLITKTWTEDDKLLSYTSLSNTRVICAIEGSKIWILAGMNNNNIYEYDIKTKSYTAKAAHITQMYGAAGVSEVLDTGEIYIAGGHRASNYSDRIIKYDTNINALTMIINKMFYGASSPCCIAEKVNDSYIIHFMGGSINGRIDIAGISSSYLNMHGAIINDECILIEGLKYRCCIFTYIRYGEGYMLIMNTHDGRNIPAWYKPVNTTI